MPGQISPRDRQRCRSAAHRHSRDLAEDLVHDIYLKWRVLKVGFPHRDDARAYLLRMASNFAIDHERVEGRRTAIKENLIAVFNAYDREAESPEAYAIASDEMRLADLELARLPGLTDVHKLGIAIIPLQPT